MVVTISIELAMDHKPSHRELASVLISDLYQKVISQRDIGKGMEKLNYLSFSKFYIRTKGQMFGGMLDLCIFLKFGSAACYNTGLKSFKLYKLKPSFLIFKDKKILDIGYGRGGGQASTPKFWKIN